MIALVAGVIGLAGPRVNDFAGPANTGPHSYFFGPLPGPVAQTFRVEKLFVSRTDVWVRVSGVRGEWPQFIGVLRDAAGTALRRSEMLGVRGVSGTPGGWWQAQWTPPLMADPGAEYLLEVQLVNPDPNIIMEIVVTVDEAYPYGQFFRAGDLAAERGQDLLIWNFTDVTLGRALLYRLTPSAGGLGVAAAAVIPSLMSIGATILLARRFGLSLRVAAPAALTAIATFGTVVLTVGTYRLIFEAVADENVVPLAQLSGIVALPISLLVLGPGILLVALIEHRRTYGDLRHVVAEPVALLAVALRALLGIRTPTPVRRTLEQLAEQSAGRIREPGHVARDSGILTLPAETITGGLALGLLAVAVPVALIGGKLTAPILPSAAFILMLFAALLRWRSAASGS